MIDIINKHIKKNGVYVFSVKAPVWVIQCGRWISDSVERVYSEYFIQADKQPAMSFGIALFYAEHGIEAGTLGAYELKRLELLYG